MKFPRLQRLLEASRSENGKFKVGDLISQTHPEFGDFTGRIVSFAIHGMWANVTLLNKDRDGTEYTVQIHQNDLIAAAEGEDLYDD